MCRVLIVDDEEIFRIQLHETLSSDGYEIAVAGTGRNAIDTAIRFRPDVLLVDWMLKDQMHGLHVMDTVRAVAEDVRTILVTGFASDELRESAERHGVFAFVEKPFDRDTIRQLVQNAAQSEPTVAYHCPIAVVMVDSTGAITFSNHAADALIRAVLDKRRPEKLSDLFGSSTPDLEAAAVDWIVVRPVGDASTFWYVRSQQPHADGQRIIVVRPQSDPQFIGGAIVGMLLGATLPTNVPWPFKGRVLVMESEPVIRRMAVSMLDSVGATCYAPACVDEACRILANDDGLMSVVFDYAFTATPAQAIARIRSLRPNVLIVGTSDGADQTAFRSLGISAYIQKPWQTQGLADAIRDATS